LPRFSGETIGWTTFRWASCLGGSIAMNIGSSRSPGLSRSVMPPSAELDEKTLCLTSTSMMSMCFVTDQKGPTGLSAH
jgi:hypothetical protein